MQIDSIFFQVFGSDILRLFEDVTVSTIDVTFLGGLLGAGLLGDGFAGFANEACVHKILSLSQPFD